MSSTGTSDSSESKAQLLRNPEEELQHSPDAEAAGEEEKAREEWVVCDLTESQRDEEGGDVDEGEVNEHEVVEETGRAIGNEEVSLEVLRCERSASLGSSQVNGKEGSVNIEGTDEEEKSSIGKEVQLAGVYQSTEAAEHEEHVEDNEYIVCEYQLYFCYKDSDAKFSVADVDADVENKMASFIRKNQNKLLLYGNGGEMNFIKGRCKWFNVVKGYGFITPEFGGNDVFVHQSTIKMDGFRSLERGEEVEFKYHETMQGFEATEVRGPDGQDLVGSSVRPRSKRQKLRCYNCGEFQRHLAKTCPEPLEKRCYRCKGLDHIVAQCTMSKVDKPGVDCNETSVDPVNPSNIDVNQCYNCGEFQRHLAKKCPEPSEKRCYRCKGPDHIAAQCPMPREDKPGVYCNETSVDPVNPSNVDVNQSTVDVIQSTVDAIQSTVDVIQSNVDVIQSTVDVIQSSDASHTLENETLSINHTQSSGGDVPLSSEPGESIEEGIQSTENVAVG